MQGVKAHPDQHLTLKKIVGMLKELLDYDGESGARPLTDWEIEFAESMNTIAGDPEAVFSIKQAAKIEHICQEVFG